MHIYIPIIPILWGVLIWAGIGTVLYVPLSLWLDYKLAKVNMGYRRRSILGVLKTFVTKPIDTFTAIMAWPLVAYSIWDA